MTKSLRWIRSDVCTLSTYDGLSDVHIFLHEYCAQVPFPQRLVALDIMLQATPARWWVAHKHNINSWEERQRLLEVIFTEQTWDVGSIYNVYIGPRLHIDSCLLS